MLNIGQKVFVYRNLHKHCFSVRDEKTRRVVLHTRKLTLKHAEFKVYQRGRERVLRERRKNVHAGIRGIYVGEIELPRIDGYVYYDPYKVERFIDRVTMNPLNKVDLVQFNDNHVYYYAGN